MSFLVWPRHLFPTSCKVGQVAVTRSGGPSFAGGELVTHTDRGRWAVDYGDIVVRNAEQRRIWNATRTTLGGRAGLVVVPVLSFESAPFAEGAYYSATLPHSDDAFFGDDTGYFSESILDIRMETLAPIGATVVNLRRVIGAPDLAGIRFSYNHALYETGMPLATPSGDVWQVPIFPAVRAAIPAGASLECVRPTCLMHLSSDREMDITWTRGGKDTASVSFTEAVDYWSDLAAGG